MKEFLFLMVFIASAVCAFAQSEKQLTVSGGSIKPESVNYPVSVEYPAKGYTAINLLNRSFKTADYKLVTVKLSAPATDPLVLLVSDLEPNKVEAAFNGATEITIDLTAYRDIKKVKNIRLLSAAPETDVTYTITEAYLTKIDGSKVNLTASNMNAKSLCNNSATFTVPALGWETLFRYATPDIVDVIKQYKSIEIEFAEPLQVELHVEFNTEENGHVNVIGNSALSVGQTKYTVNIPADKSYTIVHLVHFNDPDGKSTSVTIKSVKLTE